MKHRDFVTDLTRALYAAFLLWSSAWTVSADQAEEAMVTVPAVATDAAPRTGEQVYKFYCYQCHGYAGNGATASAGYLSPPPRDFTKAPAFLTRDRMLRAVTHGRPGTAMAGFASVLDEREIEAVVDYVRATFMAEARPYYRYHTAENGWPDHQRYAPAFPFVLGQLSARAAADRLSASQLMGREMFLQACINCHEPRPVGVRN